MSLLDEIYLRRDIQREQFLSVIEFIDMIEGIESVDYSNVLDILEHFNVFDLPTYILSNDDDKNPLYKKSSDKNNIRQNTVDYLNAKISFTADAIYFDKYQTLTRSLGNYNWSRIDLLKIESLVKFTDIVNWGEARVLKRMYSDMLDDSSSEFYDLPKIAQESIVNYLNESNKISSLVANKRSESLDTHLGEHQKRLITYELFAPEKIACLLTDSNPAYNHNHDDYNACLDMISNAIDAGKLIYVNDNYEISAGQVKLWLKSINIIFEGFNDDISLEKSIEVSKLQMRIDELEIQLAKYQPDKSHDIVIPYGKRQDFIDKNLPQSERIEKSYEIYSDNISFHEDNYPVNTPKEMVKRIQGLIKVIRKKDLKINELEKQLKQAQSSVPIQAKSRAQDPKLIAMMAILLADKNSKYKWGEKPNKSAIEKDIHRLIENKFFVDNKHTHGLEAPHKRIADCLTEFSEFFYTALKTKKN